MAANAWNVTYTIPRWGGLLGAVPVFGEAKAVATNPNAKITGGRLDGLEIV